MFNFVFDHQVNGEPYPNLAPHKYTAFNGFEGMGDEYPHITSIRLLKYTQDHNYPVNISYINEPIPDNAFYPIGLAFFNYEVDYFSMLSEIVKNLCRESKLKILFYYHEGDNPHYEKIRLDQLCIKNNLPTSCYQFISGNTESKSIKNFAYFPDHELYYWRNSVIWNDRSMPGCSFHTRPRPKQFTALSRVHKWWRATILSDLKSKGLLNNSYMSYNKDISHGDHYNDNPIEIKTLNIENQVNEFIRNAPYKADGLTDQEHNSHWVLEADHFDKAYCNLVLETLYDAEQSNGTFISEKTFKPIRHAQLFVVFGTPNTLSVLKELGYKTFDHLINNSYDAELNNTKRFLKTVSTVKDLTNKDLHEIYVSARDDLLHNQELFLSSKYNRIDDLYHTLIKNKP